MYDRKSYSALGRVSVWIVDVLGR